MLLLRTQSQTGVASAWYFPFCMIGHFVHSQHLRVSSEVNQSIPGHKLARIVRTS